MHLGRCRHQPTDLAPPGLVGDHDELPRLIVLRTGRSGGRPDERLDRLGGHWVRGEAAHPRGAQRVEDGIAGQHGVLLSHLASSICHCSCSDCNVSDQMPGTQPPGHAARGPMSGVAQFSGPTSTIRAGLTSAAKRSSWLTSVDTKRRVTCSTPAWCSWVRSPMIWSGVPTKRGRRRPRRPSQPARRRTRCRPAPCPGAPASRPDRDREARVAPQLSGEGEGSRPTGLGPGRGSGPGRPRTARPASTAGASRPQPRRPYLGLAAVFRHPHGH